MFFTAFCSNSTFIPLFNNAKFPYFSEYSIIVSALVILIHVIIWIYGLLNSGKRGKPIKGYCAGSLAILTAFLLVLWGRF